MSLQVKPILQYENIFYIPGYNIYNNESPINDNDRVGVYVRQTFNGTTVKNIEGFKFSKHKVNSRNK